ncbi:phosphate/phosphite/phosphonate ABC transporter substrate-binding protein [Paenibacillus assamensis]|uniref:phosphate/phosphite/phosphonate ABC transporter substrate-binding protein n=1 Tax=Paenibacillus assamensis TaxID=311244 RepID=UPI000406D141|nr:phosphate/phosphite/phosphonate ABC transporter substrate-binding protein [Paenibacillus assamensis]
MFKKTAITVMTLILGLSLLTACSNSSTSPNSSNPSKDTEQTKAYVPTELKVQFVPSQNAETLEAKAKPLEKLLRDQLGIPVKVSVSTNYNTIIEALASKQVDIGFLPPNAYVLAHDTKKTADILLQAQRFGVEDATGANTAELVDYYKAMIVVKKDSPIQKLEDLKGKKIAWQDVTSSAGYVWPAYEMKKAGVDPDADVTGITVKGHDKALLAVLNGDVDAAAVFQDARNIIIKDIPDIMQTTRVVAFTSPIPNDTISVRNDMSEEWRTKIQDAFIAIGKDPAGQQIISDVYSHKGYIKSDDSKFNIVRDVAKEVGLK